MGEVPGVWVRPAESQRVLVFAHGAGAGMRHPFMETVSARLAERGIATLRYEFPYMAAGRRRPDPPRVLIATVRAAVLIGEELAEGLPVLAGGKSMGGRMTSAAAAADALPAAVEGLVFFGFPLHAAGRPARERADHLRDVDRPMLFLQGTRDPLAALELVRSTCEELGPRARLHIVGGADHSFRVLKRSGRTATEVLDELADVVASWSGSLASLGSLESS